MIRVECQPEYPGFDSDVRVPGQNFLTLVPNPTTAQFKKKRYWSKSLNELISAYGGRCAFTTRRLVETGSVDHFRPKSIYPHLAYEWDNFRFCRQSINSRKGNSEELLDPFAIVDGWFVLDLPSCLIKPAPHLVRETRVGVNKTVATLGLNQDEKLVGERSDLLIALAQGLITLEYLDGFFPFISKEVRRQGVSDDLRDIFSLNNG